MNKHPHWEQRWHPLREEWVIVTAHRQNRPWHGEKVNSGADAPDYVAIGICPGNVRIGGARNTNFLGDQTFDQAFGIGKILRPTACATIRLRLREVERSRERGGLGI